MMLDAFITIFDDYLRELLITNEKKKKCVVVLPFISDVFEEA
jgi:hypothetical protein